MPDVIHARLSAEIPQPELSKMWESERTTFTSGIGDGIETFLTAPELVIEAKGRDVELRFQPGESEARDKVKRRFEEAVHLYRPDVRIDWLD